jgi:hypothetical protein
MQPPDLQPSTVMHGRTIGATEQAGRLREELVHRVLVSWLNPGLGDLAVTNVIDEDLVVVQLLARSLAADGKQRHRGTDLAFRDQPPSPPDVTY